jgi:hypothetical protein
VGPIELLILIALGVAIGTALRRAVRTRNEHGPDAPEAVAGHLLADIGVRVGAVLLVMSVVGLAAISGSTEASDYNTWHTAFVTFIVVSLLMIAFGGYRLHHDRQAALRAEPATGSAMQRCPHCAESIQAAAHVCRFCGGDVEPQT